MIVAGFGYRASAGVGSLRSALDAACAQAFAGIQSVSIAALAAPADKVALLNELGSTMGLPVIAVEKHHLEIMATATRSEKSLQTRGTGSVAEASALAAAGESATLLCLRAVSQDRMATCALAEGTHS